MVRTTYLFTTTNQLFFFDDESENGTTCAPEKKKGKNPSHFHIYQRINADRPNLQSPEYRVLYIHNSKDRTMRISNIYQGLLGLVALVGVTAFAPQKSAQLFGVFDRSRNVVGRGSSSLMSAVVEAPTAESATGSTTANIR